MAKNKMRRCFAAILDPHPSASEVNKLWRYFSSSCAYCGVSIDRKSRSGHVDHVVPSAIGGGNGIHNHVLACGRCNGDEKREEHWQSFLERKCQDQSNFASRKQRIEAWLGLAKERQDLGPEQRAKALAAEASAIQAFDKAVEELRRLRAAQA